MLSSSNPLAARFAGVKAAPEGPSNKGTPNTVLQVTKAEVVFVHHYDQRGNPAVAMYFKVGGQYVSTQDTTAWCEKLYPMSPWMRKEMDAMLASSAPPADAATLARELPTEDNVDILGGCQ